MHTEKHQFEVKKNRRHRVVGRSGGGYVVGGIPWFQMYYGGYWGGTASGNDNSPNETAQNGFGQESGNVGDAGGSAGVAASDGGGSGAM